jgi:hypothetical protein
VTSPVHWETSCRLIAARLPRIDVFERVVDPLDLDAILVLEALTNPRIHAALGPLALIAPEDRVTGPGSSYIMAPFAYPAPSRFTDGRFGVYYAAAELSTAVAEIVHHRERFLAATSSPALELDLRVVEARIDAACEDLRDVDDDDPRYDRDSYVESRQFATMTRGTGVDGIVYRSVRDAGGTCIGIFRPRCLVNARTTRYLGFRWDGTCIVDVYTKQSLSSPYTDELGP